MQIQEIKSTLKGFERYFPPRLRDLGRSAWRTLEIPFSAILQNRRVLEAHRIIWPVAQVADFEGWKMLGPGPNDVLVNVAFTLMSPGTERAQLLGLTFIPPVGFPFWPGYSGSGEVISVGNKVKTFKIGDRVAGRIRHASLYVTDTQWLFHIPPQVSSETAAFIELGIIVLQGIRKARIKPGESVIVLGQGLIGQLSNRLSRLAGGAPVVAVARSRAKASYSTCSGGADQFFTVDQLNPEVINEGFDVVIEASGNADALPLAFSLARTNGRVVLLASPRSLVQLHLGQEKYHPSLRLIGAQISGMPDKDQTDGLWRYQDEGYLFLDLLAQGKLVVDDLITHRYDPSQASSIYESLRMGDSAIIGLIFNWSNYGAAKRPVREDAALMERNVSSPLHLKRKLSSWRVDFDKTPWQPLPPHKQLRVGVVGGGDIGLSNATSVKAAPAARVMAVYDANFDVLKDLAMRLDVPAMPDYDSLLARPDVDAVLLSVPHALHAPLAIQAAQAGKHVLLEKPLGVNLHDATQIVEACRIAGVRLTVNFSFRYLPIIQVIRELIRDGVLGDICGVQINRLELKGASYWAGGNTARSPANWRGFKEKAGGGILMMIVSHPIDYLRYCTGLEVKRVFSEYGTFDSPVEVEDAIGVTCQYENGAIGSITASTLWRGTPCNEIRIWGKHGSLTMKNNNSLSFLSARRWRELAAAKEHKIETFNEIDYTSVWIQRFAVALANDEPHEITGKDGWLTNAVIEAAYNSRDQGHPVDVETFYLAEKS